MIWCVPESTSLKVYHNPKQAVKFLTYTAPLGLKRGRNPRFYRYVEETPKQKPLAGAETL